MTELQADIQVYKLEEEGGEKTLLGEFKGVAAEAIDFIVEIPEAKTAIDNLYSGNPFGHVFARKGISDFLSGNQSTYNIKNPQGINVIRIVKRGPVSAPSPARAPVEIIPFGKKREKSTEPKTETPNGGNKKRKTRKQTQRRRKTRRILKSKH